MWRFLLGLVQPLKSLFVYFFSLENQQFELYCRWPVDRKGVHSYLFSSAFEDTLSHPHFAHNYCNFISFYFHISAHIPSPPQLPRSLIVALTERPLLSPFRVLGGMYITDQRFYCLLCLMGSSTVLGPVCVKSDVYKTENLLHFSPHPSFR